MKLNVEGHFKCWLWRLANLLWAEHKSNCGITCLRRENVNDYACPGRPSTSTTDENIEAVKKMILYNRRITIWEVADDVGILFDLCQAIFMDVLGMKCAGAKILLSKNNVAWTSLRRRWRCSTTIQICSKRSYLVMNHGCMAMILKPKPKAIENETGAVSEVSEAFRGLGITPS